MEPKDINDAINNAVKKYITLNTPVYSNNIVFDIGSYAVGIGIGNSKTSFDDVVCTTRPSYALDIEDVYSILRDGILNGTIYIMWLSVALIPRDISSTMSELDTDICCSECKIHLIITDVNEREREYSAYTHYFQISELYKGGITESDLIITTNHILVSKNIKKISLDNTGFNNRVKFWFKEPVSDSDGSILDEGFSSTIFMNDLEMTNLKSSLEATGRYDLLLNL